KAAKHGGTVLVFGSLSLARAIYQADFSATGERAEIAGDATTLRLEGGTGQTLLSQLQEKGVMIPATCGGNGQCGKCRVRVTAGEVPVSEEDQRIFSEDELRAGWRLACRARAASTVEVALPREDFADMQTASVATHTDTKDNTEPVPTGKPYGIAIDIGTTTLAVSLVRRSDGTSLDTRTRVNPQVSYGADVITRIRAAEDGKADAMRVAICEALLEEIETNLVRHGIGYADIEAVVVAGNTTMLHLLQGYDVSGLGRHPFTPVTTALEKRTMKEVFDVVPDWPLEEITAAVPVILLPGVSAFVGADIVSGLYALDFDKNDKIFALIDLGTNGELVIGDKNRRLVTSTAAGPALEGGNIRYGTASIIGAVSGVRLEKDEAGLWQAEVERIGEYTSSGSGAERGQDLPVAPGICGTGVIGMVAELKRTGLIDANGLLSEEYFEDGFPFAMRGDGTILTFNQDDIREVQLAKAAIRAGLDILCERYGIGVEQLDKVYIAGGFGTFLPIDRAVAIGLLPEEIADRTEAVGNTSLAGAIRMLTEPDAEARMEALAAGCETLSLAEDDAFQKRYVEAMSL
ncbi:MAG: ASKHA domain-containing protein, partial [Eubacterium sp.]|nr:ASKHA domain-containing protein [Eubacterium sp.]